MTTTIEYRVRPVTRYIATRYYSVEHENGTCEGGCEERGEFDHADTAYAVAYALCKQEHERHGWPLDDERIVYPVHPRDLPEGVNVQALSGPLQDGNLDTDTAA